MVDDHPTDAWAASEDLGVRSRRLRPDHDRRGQQRRALLVRDSGGSKDFVGVQRVQSRPIFAATTAATTAAIIDGFTADKNPCMLTVDPKVTRSAGRSPTLPR